MRIAKDEDSWKLQQSSREDLDYKVSERKDRNIDPSLTVKDAIAAIRTHPAHKPHLQRHHHGSPTHKHEFNRWKADRVVARQYSSIPLPSTYLVMTTSAPTSMEIPSPSIYSHPDSMSAWSETTPLIPSYGTRSSNLSSTYWSGPPSSLIYYTTAIESSLPSPVVSSSSVRLPTPPYPTSSFGVNGTWQSTLTTQMSVSSTTPEPWDPLISIIISIASLRVSASNHLTLTATNQAFNVTSVSTQISIPASTTVSTSIITATTPCDVTSDSSSAIIISSTSDSIIVVNSTVYVIPVRTSTETAGFVPSSFILPSSAVPNTSSLLDAQSEISSSISSQLLTTFATSFVSTSTTFSTSFISSSTAYSTSSTSSTNPTSTSAHYSSTPTLVVRTSYATDHTAPNVVVSSTILVPTSITASSITASPITASPITASLITASSITASSIATSSITASSIIASSITASSITASSIIASSITASSVTASSITASTSSAAAAPTTTTVSLPATSIKSSTPTSTVVGSVVGSVAGLAVLLALLLLFLRWWKRRNFAGGHTIDNGSRPMTADTTSPPGPSSSHVFLPPVAAGVLNRLSLASLTGRPQSIPPPARPSDQPAFERLSGRKLPSQFSPGIEGPVSASYYPSGSSAYPSITQPEMVENPFLDPIPSLGAAAVGIGAVGAATTAEGSRRNQEASFESDRNRETLMPSPARTPVLRSAPEGGRKSFLAAPGVTSTGTPGRTLTPSWVFATGMSGSPARPETRGSTATLGSRFREDIT